MSWQINTDTREKEPESSIGGNLRYTAKTLRCVLAKQNQAFVSTQDWFGHFCKVSQTFEQICKLSKLRKPKKVVKC